MEIKLGIWKLSMNDTPMSGDMTGCIVIAASEKQAREIANSASKAEGYIWTDGHKVDAVRLGTLDADGGAVAPEAGVVLSTTE
jgi:hypothetical protein